MCQIFVVQVSFLSSERAQLDYCVYIVKILFNLNSQGNAKFELFSQGTYDFQNFRNKILFIANYKHVKKSAF